jgi:hypothetical protein
MTQKRLASQYLTTPVLLLVFNRPDTTARVFETIRQARPQRLYIASDGPRAWKNGETQKVIDARKVALAVDWKCEVKTLFRRKNLGCKAAVESAITWFFTQEKEGIVLEDDCVPNSDFFLFCEKNLKKYRNNKKILTILGNNFQDGKIRGSKSYYFSKYFHCWGWATWRRTWNYYDGHISFWPKWKQSLDWISKFSNKEERQYWSSVFDKVYLNQIDTWDYPFITCLWKKGGFNIIPNVNLVSNIGFGENATHTIFAFDKYSNIAVSSIGRLTHPNKVEQCMAADKYTFDNLFEGKNSRMPWLLLNLPIRILKYFVLKLKKKKFNKIER